MEDFDLPTHCVPTHFLECFLKIANFVAPLYDALNEPLKKDVVALLGKATNADYRSCSTNQDCLDRDKLAGQFKYFGTVIPDLHWRIIDIWTAGDRIVVRGEATGTPVAPLFGVAPMQTRRKPR